MTVGNCPWVLGTKPPGSSSLLSPRAGIVGLCCHAWLFMHGHLDSGSHASETNAFLIEPSPAYKTSVLSTSIIRNYNFSRSTCWMVDFVKMCEHINLDKSYLFISIICFSVDTCLLWMYNNTRPHSRYWKAYGMVTRMAIILMELTSECEQVLEWF